MITDDDAIWALCAIGRIPSSFEWAMTSMGATPFTASEVRRLKATDGPPVIEYHGSQNICGNCGHWYRAHDKSTAVEGGCQCWKHCGQYYCKDTGLLMKDGNLPNCPCVLKSDENLQAIREAMELPDVRRTDAVKTYRRYKRLQRERNPGKHAKRVRRLRCLTNRHEAKDLLRDPCQPEYLFVTKCIHCNRHVHKFDLRTIEHAAA